MQALRRQTARAVFDAAGYRIASRMQCPRDKVFFAVDRRKPGALSRQWFSSQAQREEAAKDPEAASTSDENKADAKAEATADKEADEPSAKDATAEEAEAPSAALEKELAALQDSVRARKHELLLSLADFENNKKRFTKEREDRRRASMVNFATEMIKVYGHFDAFAAEKHDAGAVRALHEGVALTRDLYKASFERFGVRPIHVEIGEPFVPARHANVGTIESTQLQQNAVGEIVKQGWILEPDSPKPVVLQKTEVHVSTQGPKVPAS
mmetsp:Transcript_40058/g.74679  ORF Transcript_40058/g.74679 Transcript_40058/m.74679 type:complete len:268 (+) Transcript_40058:55-858(+)